MSNNRGAWTRKRMFEIGDFYNGLSGKVKEDFLDGNAKFITYMNVYKNMFAKNDMVESVLIRENESQTIVRYGDILFSQSSETLEEVGLTSVWLNSAEVYLNSFCFGFRIADKKILDSKYAGYLFRSYQIRKRIVKEGQGNIRVNLSSSRLRNLELCLPPLPEQKKIAEILSTWDEAIELKTKVMAELSNNLQKNIDTLTKTNTFIDEKYLDMSFNDLASFVNGFPFDSSTYQDNGKYKIVTIGNVQDGYFDLSSNVKYINNLPVGIDEKQILKTGDIIMSMTGNVGRVCQVNHEDCLLNQRVGKIVPHKNVNRLYLFYAVRSRRFIRKMITSSQGGAQPNLSTKDIKSYRFAIPGLETQKVVAGYLQLYESNIKLLSKEIDLLKTQKQGLMQRLLTGKVRVKLD